RVRVFYRTGPERWEENVRLLAGSGLHDPPDPVEEQKAMRQIKEIQVISIQTRGRLRLLTAIAPTLGRRMRHDPEQLGTALVTLTFDETQSVTGRLRRLIWPLMALAIVAITLITWFLFRYLVYQPIDALLLRMAKAEAGDLATETQPV